MFHRSRLERDFTSFENLFEFFNLWTISFTITEWARVGDLVDFDNLKF